MNVCYTRHLLATELSSQQTHRALGWHLGLPCHLPHLGSLCLPARLCWLLLPDPGRYDSQNERAGLASSTSSDLTCSLWGGQLASVQGNLLKLCSRRSWWSESQGWNAGSKTQCQGDHQAPFNPRRQRSKLCIWKLSQKVSTYLSQRGWEEVCCKLTRPAFWLSLASVKRMTFLKLQGHSCRSGELIGRP